MRSKADWEAGTFIYLFISKKERKSSGEENNVLLVSEYAKINQLQSSETEGIHVLLYVNALLSCKTGP